MFVSSSKQSFSSRTNNLLVCLFYNVSLINQQIKYYKLRCEQSFVRQKSIHRLAFSIYFAVKKLLCGL